MADASDTGAGDAVLTVLDRFLAAGISQADAATPAPAPIAVAIMLER